MLRFHTQTAGSTLTAQQPEVNVVRTTIQHSAAVLGRTNRCTRIRWTKRSRFADRIGGAHRASERKQVIANESGVADLLSARRKLRD
jgi:methylmalonyl-CoA mutase N-terminal domain/subunit